MRVLVIFAHPVESSFNAALHRTVVDALTKAGHEVDDLDLYAEDFDPRLSREERLNYHDLDINQLPVKAYVERLQRADALVMVYPVWNFGYPAILKGFFDRVFLPGVSFKMVNGKATPCLHNITKVAAVTHYGGHRLRAFLVGNPPKKAIMRVLRVIVKPFAPFHYLALYDMNRQTQSQREAFLNKVRVTMEGF